jgi:nucleoid-associated protein YgaU
MSEAQTPTKAVISKADNESKQITCHFNPDSFDIAKTISWTPTTTIGGNVSALQFSGGQAHELGPVEFVFDTTDTGQDVREQYKVLTDDLAQIDPDTINQKTGKGHPPKCKFHWGSFLSFTAVITKLDQTFTMFKADGTPLRAKVKVTFLEVPESLQPQNPTSRSQARKVWVVQEGQTLDWIAHQEYGDSAYWRHIAETNDLANPRELYPGQRLRLVPLP